MTTIATDGHSMAGDTLTCASTIMVRHAVKVFRCQNGQIFGCCGATTDAIKFQEYMLMGGEKPTLSEDFSALVLNVDGSVDWIDKEFVRVSTAVPNAIGSGGEIALGAMLAGQAPENAVRTAMIRDTNTGGDVTVEHLQPKMAEAA
jgi:ATP-dependent protease HslVU (ClpYQ) peptidase subunit